MKTPTNFSLYLIGGPSRSGKSTIAREVAGYVRAPFLSTDLITKGVRGIPQLGLDEKPSIGKNSYQYTRLFLTKMLGSIAAGKQPYVVEGRSIRPDLISELMANHPGRIAACLIGYPDAELQTKLAQLQSYTDELNPWFDKQDEGYQKGWVEQEIRFSQELRQQAEKAKIPFFDVEDGLKDNINAIFNLFEVPTHNQPVNWFHLS